MEDFTHPEGAPDPELRHVFPTSLERARIGRGANRARLDPGGVPRGRVVLAIVGGLALAMVAVAVLVGLAARSELLAHRDLSSGVYWLLMAFVVAATGVCAAALAQRVVRSTGGGSIHRHPMRDWAEARGLAIPRGRPALPRLAVFGDARRRGAGMWAVGLLGGGFQVTVGEVATGRRTLGSRRDRRTFVLLDLTDGPARLIPALTVARAGGAEPHAAVELHPLPREGSVWPDRRFEVLSLPGMPPGIGRLLATSLLEGLGDARCAFWEQRGSALALWVPGWRLGADELDQLVRDAWETAQDYERLAAAISLDVRRGVG